MNPCQSITDAETALLATLEEQIRTNLEAVQTGHLYRAEAEDFNTWLRQRFNLVPVNGGGQ